MVHRVVIFSRFLTARDGTVGYRTRVYMWQGFVTRTRVVTPIRELVAPADA